MTVGTAEIIEFYNGMLPVMEKYHDGGNFRLEIIHKAVGRMIRPGMRVLEIGCGVGVTSKYMAEAGAVVRAVDISPELIYHASKHAAHDNINYVICDACEGNLAIVDEYELIVLADVLEHILPHKIQGLVRDLCHLASHDATFIYLNIPDYQYNTYLRKHSPHKLQIVDEGYTIQQVVTLFATNGFVPVHMQIHAAQYNEYIFVKEQALEKHFKGG